MAEQIWGQDWNEREVEACVKLYFDCFQKQISGTPFVKSHVYQKFSEATGRTSSSVESKFQNISAVLDELGLDWISGLAPRRHYQELLANVIAEILPSVLTLIPENSTESVEEAAALYLEAAPERATVNNKLPTYIETLVKKFDPVERDRKNTLLGEAGEKVALEYEMNSLIACEQPLLARQVRWISKLEGDGAGYDILSFEPNGEKRFVEVKTTVGGNKTPFFISRNEYEFSKAERERYHLLRLFDFRKKPRLFQLSGDLDRFVRLSTESFRADFHA